MRRAAATRYAALPTAAKLFLILTAAILPIGIALVLMAESEIHKANETLRGRADDQTEAAARSIESLIARNALALRIAANGALAGGGDPCERTQRSLAVAPAVAHPFEIRAPDGEPICSVGPFEDTRAMQLVAPGDIALEVAGDREGIIFRAGVIGGMATGKITAAEIRSAARHAAGGIDDLFVTDGERRVGILSGAETAASGGEVSVSRWPIANGDLEVHVMRRIPTLTTVDRILLLLPVVMSVVAALFSWQLVSRLLIRPLKTLELAVRRLEPGEGASALPRKLGPAAEIQQLRDAFARSVERIEESEHEMAAALDGQRRLVREVHHRVKNNLQVIASLLNIHGRTATMPEARAAYASIGRRVGALSIVHRNHFAEMEETRGIVIRPLLAELTAELRAGAPDEARGLAIDLEVESVHTTQDVAVSITFLVTWK